LDLQLTPNASNIIIVGMKTLTIRKGSQLVIKTIRSVFLLALIISVPIAARPQCLETEPAAVTLTGTIYAKNFPGPPNFESTRSGDERMRYWIFRLDKPICVEGDSFDNTRAFNVRDLQLAFPDGSFYTQYRRDVREHRRFKVTGSLFHQQTGHHVTKILITIKTLTPFRK
jgi:hypothetical protein